LGFLQRLAEQDVELAHLGRDLDDAFENMSTAYEAWDRMFHLASVRILHTNSNLLTSAFPTSSFEDVLDVDGVAFPYHVTMAIDRRVLAHVMVRGFDPDERVRQQFWIAPAEEQIVLRHNLAQIARFVASDDVEYLVHRGRRRQTSSVELYPRSDGARQRGTAADGSSRKRLDRMSPLETISNSHRNGSLTARKFRAWAAASCPVSCWESSIASTDWIYSKYTPTCSLAPANGTVGIRVGGLPSAMPQHLMTLWTAAMPQSSSEVTY
jgi:hypothetical protein